MLTNIGEKMHSTATIKITAATITWRRALFGFAGAALLMLPPVEGAALSRYIRGERAPSY